MYNEFFVIMQNSVGNAIKVKINVEEEKLI